MGVLFCLLVNPVLDGDFMLGEHATLQLVVHTVDWKKARDVGIQACCNWNFHGMCCYHLQDNGTIIPSPNMQGSYFSHKN